MIEVVHIVVLGYWLGAELVINSTYRYVCFTDSMPFVERDRLMRHVMNVDQHVRYALILQLTLGLMLALRMGYVPASGAILIAVVLAGTAWLVFVEIVHRYRDSAVGARLAGIDRGLRYLVLVTLVAVGTGLVGDIGSLPAWLNYKLLLFAGVIACGIGIRLALLTQFRIWSEMAAAEVTAAHNEAVQRIYRLATSILLLLWLLIAAIAWLSVAKPALG